MSLNQCVACGAKRSRKRNIMLHKFPLKNSVFISLYDNNGAVVKRIDKLDAWKFNLGLKQKEIDARRLVVCSNHFRDEDYIQIQGKMGQMGYPEIKKHLKNNAIPTVDLPSKKNTKHAAPTVSRPPPIQQNQSMEEDVPELITIEDITVKEEPLDEHFEEIFLKEESVEEILLETARKSTEDRRCIACLSDYSAHNIFETQFQSSSLANILELCTSYSIPSTDVTILKFICDSCYQELINCYSFREKFVKTQLFLKVIKGSKNAFDSFDSSADTISAVSCNLLEDETMDNDDDEAAKEEPTIDTVILEISEDEDPLGDLTKLSRQPYDCFLHYMNDAVEKVVYFTNLDMRRQGKVQFSSHEELTKEELLALIGILIYSCASKNTNLDALQLFDSSVMGKLYKSLMDRERFNYILDSLRFDDTRTRSNELPLDLFAPIRDVWELFMEICKKSYPTDSTFMMLEQQLPCDGHCRFRQFSPKTIPKSSIQFTTLFDSSSNYIVSSVPCLGGSTRPPDGFKWLKAKARDVASFEQLWSTINCSRKTKRWPMVVFYDMINIALINSYVMHLLSMPSSSANQFTPLSRVVFLKSVGDALIQPWSLIKNGGTSKKMEEKS